MILALRVFQWPEARQALYSKHSQRHDTHGYSAEYAGGDDLTAALHKQADQGKTTNIDQRNQQ
ncbi:hypothetical protein D3C77_639520 [compost metagenome]